jgi:xylulokinase
MAIVLGVDSSTQSTKVEARRLDTGELVAVGRAPHPATAPPRSEQDPAAWWTALVDAVGQLGEHRRDVVAISVAGQQHGMVVVDASGVPLRPAKLWNDTESADAAAALVAARGAPWWAEACGSVPVAAFTVSKVAWLATAEPAVWARVDGVLLPHDWLTFMLCGRRVTDRGDASGTGWWSATGYVADVLGMVGLQPDQLPAVLEPGEAAGPITPAAAAALALPAGVLVGPGTGDNMAAALGLGLRTGDVAISLGTSGTVYAVSAQPTADPAGEVAGFADATGAFLPLVCTLNATKVTDSVAGWLGTDAAGLAAMALAASGDGPVLVPYFDGERTPNLPLASGFVTGLTNATTREQLARAAHDGVVCGLLAGRDALVRAGVPAAGRLFLVGGGARSAAYRQRLADLAEADVLVPDTDETVATGAAVQAAMVAQAAVPNEITRRWGLGVASTVTPRADAAGPEVRARYAAAASLMERC